VDARLANVQDNGEIHIISGFVDGNKLGNVRFSCIYWRKLISLGSSEQPANGSLCPALPNDSRGALADFMNAFLALPDVLVESLDALSGRGLPLHPRAVLLQWAEHE
jgi:hypothetical protein